MGYELNKTVSLTWLCEQLEVDLPTDTEAQVLNIAPSNQVSTGSLSFTTSEESFLAKDAYYFGPKNRSEPNVIRVDNPRLSFILALGLLNKEAGFSTYDFESVLPASLITGHNVVIERGVRIGERCHIDHGVVIRSGTTIGDDCYVGPNTCIGSEGFGYERAEDKTPIKFVHLGGVTIGDRVEIGALNGIDRGTLGNTIIEDDTKTDNFVHIGHNVRVCTGALLTACSEVSGGVRIGEFAWLAPNSCINQKLDIGDDAIVGLGAVVTKDVKTATIVAGSPAKYIRDV
jgi:UDP-3-O-[3-hydroxymyristoyl] glucosamine N-acyltransferase LpxD